MEYTRSQLVGELHLRSVRRCWRLDFFDEVPEAQCYRAMTAGIHPRSARSSAVLCTIGWATRVERQKLTGV